MACETFTETIDGVDVSTTQWPAEKAMVNKLKIAKLFGSSIAKLSGIASEERSEYDQISIFGECVNGLFETNTPESIVEFIKSMIIGTAYDGTKITESSFQSIFSGEDLFKVYKVLFFVIKSNYPNFIKGQIIKNYLAKAKSSLNL